MSLLNTIRSASSPRLFPGKLLSITVLTLITHLVLADEEPVEPSEAVVDPVQIEQGRQIYQEGLLPSGQVLQVKRLGAELKGQEAACAACHRASGMGSLEGKIVVPPITGRFLFPDPQDQPRALVDPTFAKNVSKTQVAYTDAALAAAIRAGVNVRGEAMNALMPHYDFDDQSLAALTAYLKQLNTSLSPGVYDDSVQFATILTPDVPAERRSLLISMMRAAFTQRNTSLQNMSGRMKMPYDLVPRTHRNWELSVWELQGSPDSWHAQLEAFYRDQPVFAVISGLSNSTWEPVDQFCQQQKLPCVFPSVLVPPANPGFYSLFYSRGVLLEADVLGKHLTDLGDKAPKQIIQIYQDDQIAQAAARQLQAALNGSGIDVRSLPVSAPEVSKLLHKPDSRQALMFWLDAEHLADLQRLSPRALTANSYASGYLLANQFEDLNTAWKSSLHLLYPYDIGNPKLQSNTQLLKLWLSALSLPLVDQPQQIEIFSNLLTMTDMVSQLLDNFYRDYMVERIQDMLSWGTNSTYYPRLSLGRGQQFASKGAYIARFDKHGLLQADSEWIVP